MASSSWRRRILPLAVLGAASCGSELPPLMSGSSSGAQAPPAVLYGVDFDGYRAANHEVEVRAETAEVDSVTGHARLWEVRIRFEEPGRGPVEVKAERAEVDLASDDFVLSGRVEGSLGSRERFYTSELRYQRERERLWTDRPARLVGARTVVRGQGLELDLRTRRLRLLGSVDADILSGAETGP
ncbi:MAG: LPS export ABC transporter periplasmic protein LptC [Myxococcales bacterium]|nr:LPS export ABC transporter periplasmic protein LptC [Myxococcales bacterium]